jgi:hypothetical protein
MRENVWQEAHAPCSPMTDPSNNSPHLYYDRPPFPAIMPFPAPGTNRITEKN